MPTLVVELPRSGYAAGRSPPMSAAREADPSQPAIFSASGGHNSGMKFLVGTAHLHSGMAEGMWR